MIPKRIVYVWFGKGQKSKLINQCISANKKVLSDWEFVEYTEDNYDISTCQYIKEAYKERKYAFASDFARFDILYKYGGVYVDTDVEFLKEPPESFFKDSGFAGVEDNGKIAPGLVFACEPLNPIVKEILDSYKKDKFLLEDSKLNLKTVVDRVTEIFETHGFIINGEEQVIEGFHIYPKEYFCAYDFITRDFIITDDTVSIHHYAASWIPWHRKLTKHFKKLICRIIGKENYKLVALIKHKIKEKI